MDFTLNVPFTKVDKERRLVTGIATSDCVDKEDDIIDFAGSVDAFNNWPGNVREMHLPKAVGKMVDFKPVAVNHNGGIYSGMEATIYVSKGARDTWEKVLDGTLTGFSIGGDIIDSSYEFNKSEDKTYRRVNKYKMHELSLVDNPANPAAKITMIKSAGEGVLELQGSSSFEDIKPLYYCEKDGIAKVGDSECKDHEMVQIGFVEDFNTQEIRKMIESYENTKNGGEKSETVLHKNANTGIVNNMNEITDVQKESIAKRFVNTFFGDDSEPTPAGETENPLSGVFSPVFNITVPPTSTVEEVKVEDTKEEEIIPEVVNETEATEEVVSEVDEGGDNVDTNNEVVDQIATLLADKLESVSASIDEKIDGLQKSFDEKLEAVKTEVDAAKGDLEKFANDGAISKSVDTDEEEVATEGEASNETVEDNSFWKGAFVDREIVEALGYDS